MVLEVGGQHRLERPAQPPEPGHFDQQELTPDERRGGDEPPDVAQLDREAGTGRPCVIRQHVWLPAQFGDHESERDDRGNRVDPTPRSAPGGDAQRHRDQDQKRERNQVLGRQDAHRASILVRPALLFPSPSGGG